MMSDYLSFVQLVAAIYLSLCLEELSSKILHIQRPIVGLSDKVKYNGLLSVTDVDGKPYRIDDLRSKRKKKLIIRFYLIKSFLWLGFVECFLILLFHKQLDGIPFRVESPWAIFIFSMFPFALYWIFYFLIAKSTGHCFTRRLDKVNDKHLKYYYLITMGRYEKIKDSGYKDGLLKRVTSGVNIFQVAEECKFKEIKSLVDCELDERPRFFKGFNDKIYNRARKVFSINDSSNG